MEHVNGGDERHKFTLGTVRRERVERMSSGYSCGSTLSWWRVAGHQKAY
jgi:hypothetical protein